MMYPGESESSVESGSSVELGSFVQSGRFVYCFLSSSDNPCCILVCIQGKSDASRR